MEPRCLAGQGDLYIRLCKNFDCSLYSDSPVSSDMPEINLHAASPSPPTPHETSLSTSGPSAITPCRSAIDLTEDSDDVIEYPVFPKTTELLPRERLYEILGLICQLMKCYTFAIRILCMPSRFLSMVPKLQTCYS